MILLRRRHHAVQVLERSWKRSPQSRRRDELSNPTNGTGAGDGINGRSRNYVTVHRRSSDSQDESDVLDEEADILPVGEPLQVEAEEEGELPLETAQSWSERGEEENGEVRPHASEDKTGQTGPGQGEEG